MNDSSVCTRGEFLFTNGQPRVAVQDVVAGGTDVSLTAWMNVEECSGDINTSTRLLTSCADDSALCDNPSLSVDLYDAGKFSDGCQIRVMWTASDGRKYSFTSLNVPVPLYQWHFFMIVIRATGAVSFAVGMPNAAFMQFEGRALDRDLHGTRNDESDGTVVYAPSGVASTRGSTLTVGGFGEDAHTQGFTGAVGAVHMYLTDMSTHASGDFLNSSAACLGANTAPHDALLVPSFGIGFVGMMHDVQLYDAPLPGYIADSVRRSEVHSSCVLPPPPSPPPYLSPPPPAPMELSAMSVADTEVTPAYPAPPPPRHRTAEQLDISHPGVVSVTGCGDADATVVNVCTNYTLFETGLGGLCPLTTLFGMINESPVDVTTTQRYLLDAGVLYRSAIVSNPYDESGASHYRFWLYATEDNIGVIGTAPCAPANNTLPGTSAPTARYISTTFDLVVSGERFYGWRPVHMFRTADEASDLKLHV